MSTAGTTLIGFRQGKQLLGKILQFSESPSSADESMASSWFVSFKWPSDLDCDMASFEFESDSPVVDVVEVLEADADAPSLPFKDDVSEKKRKKAEK